MEHTTQTAPNPSEQEKQAIFARVWKRVMAGQEAACPLTWTDPVPQAETAADPAPAPADPGEGAGQPALPVACPAPQPRGDFPQAETAGVLGPGCLECAPLLQSLIRRELADGREYQTLARRASGAPARVLAALAGEKKRRARKVSGGLLPHRRGALLAGGRPLPPHALVLRGPPPAVRPGAGGHGGLPGRGGGHRGPLPAAALLGPRPGELGPGLPGAGAGRTTVLKQLRRGRQVVRSWTIAGPALRRGSPPGTGRGRGRVLRTLRVVGAFPVPRGAAPRGLRLPGGGPISPEKWGERGPGASPLDPRFYSPLVPTRWFWRLWRIVPMVGLFRCPSTCPDLDSHFAGAGGGCESILLQECTTCEGFPLGEAVTGGD